MEIGYLEENSPFNFTGSSGAPIRKNDGTIVSRERERGDVTGMTALFEPDAVVDIGGGTFLRGKEAIHEFFTKLQVTGFGPEKRKFEFGEQRPALICGDLALTSTRSRNGTVTSEVARRQKDGTWLWVIDRYSVSW